jgi:hypothetical protein
MAEYFKIDLPDKHKNIIKKIKIENNFDPFSDFHFPWKSFDGNTYEYIYRSILRASSENTPELAKDSAKIINKILELAIEKLSKNMNIKKFNKLIWLRYRTECNEFNEPRWHIDGNYNINNLQRKDLKNQKKLIISLIGPGTIILNCDEEINNEIYIKLNELNEKYPDNNNKRNLKNARKINEEASSLIDKCQMKQLENFDGVIYNIGHTHKDSCLHSEPKFDKPRLFLGLVLNEI